MELQKQQTGELEIAKILYRDSRKQALAEILDLMADQYRLEFSESQAKWWEQALADLSPQQIRNGYLAYAKSEGSSFPPQPGNIIANAGEATDKPRKIKNPDCPDCQGTGFRRVQGPGKVFKNKTVERLTDCFCVKVEYGGKTYAGPERQLAAPADDKQILRELTARVPDVNRAAKTIPPPRDLDHRNAEKLRQQAEQLRRKA